MQAEYANIISLVDLPRDVAKIGRSLGVIMKEDGTRYGVCLPVDIEGEKKLLYSLHSSQSQDEEGRPMPGQYTRRSVNFANGLRIYLEPEEVEENLNLRLQAMDLIALPISNHFLEDMVVKLTAPARSSSKIGTEVAVLGSPDTYFKLYQQRENTVASLGEVRRPIWDALEFLTTTASAGQFREVGVTGGPIVNLKTAEILGFVTSAERILVYGEANRERLGTDKWIFTQGVRTSRILEIFK